MYSKLKIMSKNTQNTGKPVNSRFNIGDIVKVINSGKQYSSYEQMAELMNLPNWDTKHSIRNNEIGEVVAIRNHATWNETICVGIVVKGKNYIIDSIGLKLIEPKLWAIEVTDENHSIVNTWWINKVKSATDHEWIKNYPSGVPIGYTVLSKHPIDDSCYYSDGIKPLIERYSGYTPISLEQFIQITKQENNMKTLDPNKEIKIGRDLLNQYYDAATKEQRGYINDNFKVDGTTTVQGIIGLHDIACSMWKPKIKQNHPECFVEESKEFDFSKMCYEELFSYDVIEALDIKCKLNQFMEVRIGGEYDNKAFWLDDEFNWELKKDSTDEWVLIPTRK